MLDVKRLVSLYGNPCAAALPAILGKMWVLLGIYAAARVTQMFPEAVPMVIGVTLHVLLPLAFAAVHGAMVYRWRG